MEHQGAHIHLALKAPFLADDEGPVAQDLSLQSAVEANLPVAEIQGPDHGDPLADKAQRLPFPAGKPPPQLFLSLFPRRRHPVFIPLPGNPSGPLQFCLNLITFPSKVNKNFRGR